MATTKNQDRVLVFLYERRDQSEAPSIDEIAKGTSLSENVVRTVLVELEELGMVKGPPSLLKEAMSTLKEIDPNFESTAAGYAEHIILIASALSKADETFLASRLGYDLEFVETVGSRLRAAGMWSKDRIPEHVTKGWVKEPIKFFLSGAIAKGDLMLVGGTTENSLYQMTKGGYRSVAAILRDMPKKRKR